MMWSTKKQIAANDTVIIWQTRDAIQPLVITPGKEFSSKFGHYRHSDLIGIPYGSKVASRVGKGFIHVLRPTPELWTMALPHRTQILYLADIAFITSHLNIKPGSRVIEAGTGSGSFSHSVARTIGSTGHLWSYEFHEARAEKAREEFGRHGMNDIVTLTHRNVCKDGFTVEDTVDAVFLDLPAPWEAVEHAKQSLRKDRMTRICCFSPCMEQVLRTVNALNDAGFTEITMFETLLRPVDVSHVPAPQSITEISAKLKQSERKREEKRLQQIAAGRQQQHKRKRDDDNTTTTTTTATVKDHQLKESLDGDDASPLDRKRLKTDGDGPDVSVSIILEPPQEEEMDVDSNEETVDPALPTSKSKSTTPLIPVGPPPVPSKVSLSKVISEVRGHTSYLTFATLLPFAPMPSPETEPSTWTTSSAPTKNPPPGPRLGCDMVMTIS
ncbi:hypothetical protein H0H93_011587 [Arthromyces matolae]|nr:hypothetical protein H0H93_011587 [Arthromyces matolae]